MPTMQEYKCPSCGGAISFNSKSQNMTCPYCDNEFPIETVLSFNDAESEGVGEKIDWNKVSCDTHTTPISEDVAAGLVSYVCESCAGEIIAEPTTGSFACPYCGNQVVSHTHFSGMNLPDLIIPFKLDKKAAKEALSNHLKGKHLLPKIFSSKNKIDSIQGVYVPFWLYDCDVDAKMRYKATKTAVWSDSKYNYVRTDHYLVRRGGSMSFKRVPADASTRLDDDYMDSLEPFDYTAAQLFNPAFLAGYGAEKYDISAKDSRERADLRIKSSTNQQIDSTVKGYMTMLRESSDIQMKSADVHYALLPVWLVSTNYHGKVYTFAMNGQTGKFVGNLPIDYRVFWAHFAGFFAVATAIAAIIMNIIF